MATSRNRYAPLHLAQKPSGMASQEEVSGLPCCWILRESPVAGLRITTLPSWLKVGRSTEEGTGLGLPYLCVCVVDTRWP